MKPGTIKMTVDITGGERFTLYLMDIHTPGQLENTMGVLAKRLTQLIFPFQEKTL